MFMVVGCWVLGVGCWLLVVGYWLLAIGCWLLAVGFWLEFHAAVDLFQQDIDLIHAGSANCSGRGLILHRLQPRLLHSDDRVRLLGWSSITAGALLAGWATHAAGNIDLEKPDRLITNGPYALVRHPLYPGWTFMYIGVALVANTRWLIVLLPILLALIQRTVLAEERQLETLFGHGYRAYKK